MGSCCLMLMKYDMTTPSRWRDTWTEWTYRILIRGKYRDVTVEYCLCCTCYITKLWLHQYNRKKNSFTVLRTWCQISFLSLCLCFNGKMWCVRLSGLSYKWCNTSKCMRGRQPRNPQQPKNNFVVFKPKDWFHHRRQFPVCETSWCVGVTGGGQWLERECSVWPNARPPAGQPTTLAYQTVDTPTT